MDRPLKIVKRLPCVLTIAGSDSSGGAGIQADLKTFAALGVYGMSAITSITAQNTVAVKAIQEVSPDIIKAQIDAVAEDIGIDAAKTGMLYTAKIIEAVSDSIRKHGFPTVVDPVMMAKSGTPLLKPEAINALISKILPLATVVTPNVMEAEIISGMKVRSLDDAKEAARKISELGPSFVVVKGGHMLSEESAIDVLYAEGKFEIFKAERYDVKTTHGTGCSFSAAIAAELAKGKDVVEAVKTAKEFVNRAIKFGLPIGHGYGPVNPMAYLYNESEKYKVIKNVSDAVRALEESRVIADLVPESQMNIVMALPYAKNRSDVAGIPGRIVRIGERVKASSYPEFNASKHVADAILAMMEHNPSIRAALNIRYSKEIVKACEELGLIVSSYDRREEPEEIKQVEGMSVRWGVRKAIEKIKKIPNVIYHTGDWGKEPMIIIFGETAVEVANIAIKIAERLTR